jgi:hypothetical protein
VCDLVVASHAHSSGGWSKVCGGCDLAWHQCLAKRIPGVSRAQKLEQKSLLKLCLSCAVMLYIWIYSIWRIPLPGLCSDGLSEDFAALTGPAGPELSIFIASDVLSCLCFIYVRVCNGAVMSSLQCYLLSGACAQQGCPKCTLQLWRTSQAECEHFRTAAPTCVAVDLQGSVLFTGWQHRWPGLFSSAAAWHGQTQLTVFLALFGNLALVSPGSDSSLRKCFQRNRAEAKALVMERIAAGNAQVSNESPSCRRNSFCEALHCCSTSNTPGHQHSATKCAGN